MKHLKRWLALLVSAALALTLLAGCGSGSIQRNSLVQLLSGQLENVQVTGDAAFDRALKTAVRQGGSDPEAVLSALAEELGISAPLSFSISALSGGKAGQQSLDVVFQPGSDPDTAANNAASGWLPTLRGLGSSGKYSARVSLAETDGGCILAIEVTVVQPGSSEESTGEDPEDGSSQPEDPEYTDDGNGNYTVGSAKGLMNLAKLVNGGKTDINITLTSGITLTGEWTPIGTESQPYTGTFDGGGKTITGLKITGSNDNAGLFGCIGDGGMVKDLNLTVTSISGYNAGGVAGRNSGTIQNCSVSGGTVTGNNCAGGVVGDNPAFFGAIENCHYTGGTVTGGYAGGVVGRNGASTVTACWSDSTVQGTSYSQDSGGVVGRNRNGGTVQACYSTGNVSGSDAGGVVGYNDSGCTVKACYHASGNVTGNGFSTGGVVGQNNNGTVTACYWKNNRSGGIGKDQGGTGETTQVDGTSVTWQNAITAMNNALQSAGTGWRYESSGGLPALTNQ